MELPFAPPSMFPAGEGTVSRRTMMAGGNGFGRSVMAFPREGGGVCEAPLGLDGRWQRLFLEGGA